MAFESSECREELGVPDLARLLASWEITLTLQVPTIEGSGAPRALYSRYLEG